MSVSNLRERINASSRLASLLLASVALWPMSAAWAQTQVTNTATITLAAGETDSDPSNNTSTVTVAVTPSADVSVTKTDGSATYVPGAFTYYTIVVTNLGPSSAVDVNILDPQPSSPVAAIFTDWSCTAAGGAICPASVGSGSLDQTTPLLPAGASLTYVVEALPPANATGNLVNSVLVGTQTPDPVPANNQASDTDTAAPQADLAVVKSLATPNPAIPGQTVSWTIQVTNNGPSTAPFTGTDTVPAAVTGLTLSGPNAASCSIAGQVVTCSSTGLVSGGVAEVTISGTLAANATGTLDNTATVSTTGGVTDTNPANNSSTSSTPIIASSNSVAKTASPASGSVVAVGDVIAYTLTTTVSGSITTQPIVLTDTLDPGLTLGTLPSQCSAAGQVLTCTVPAGTPVGDYAIAYSATVNANAGASVGNSVSGGDSCASCTTSHDVKRQVSLIKFWNNALAGDAVNLNLAGTGVSDIVNGSSTAPVAGTPGTAKAVAGATVSFEEAFTNGTATNYEATYSCTTNPGGVTVTSGTGVGGGSFTMPAGTDVACAFTNTRKAVNLVVQKMWVGASIGESVTVTGTGSATSPITLDSTALSANQTDNASFQVYAGEAITLAEVFGVPANAGNYTSDLACLGSSGLSGNVLTVGTNDTDITCTFTNTRKAVSLTVQKAWVGAVVGESVTVTGTGSATSPITLTSTTTSPNQADASTFQVYAGEAITLAEVFGVPANAGNYTSGLACVGSSGLSGNVLTVGANDTNITCTFTNTRKAVNLVVQKTWVGASIGESVTVTGTGSATSPITLDSTALSANQTDNASFQVYAGEAITLAEAFGVPANAGNYTSALACLGSSGLSGNVLTVGANDTNITCTFTNTRKAVNLVVQKTWVGASIGESVTVTGTGSATSPITLDSTALSANQTDNASFQVYAGEAITLAEAFGVPANAGNYTSALACLGSSGLSGSVLTVGTNDTDITCTFTNTRRSATLQLAKAWAANSGAGDQAQLGATTGLVNNTAAFSATAPTSNTSGPAVTVYAGEQALLPEETMSGGLLDNYAVSLACTGGTLSGTDGKSVNSLDILPADEGSNIVCTYTNTRAATTLTLEKSWLNAIAGDAIEIVADRSTGGLSPLASTATGGATQTVTGAAQPVYAGEVIQIAESFVNGTSNNYDIALSCSNTSGFVAGALGVGGTLTIGPNDGPITCAWTNDRKSAQLIVRKAWSGPSPGASVDIPASSGFANNTPAFGSTFPTSSQVGPVEVFVEENGTLGAETFTSGSAADFTQALSCDGSDTDPANGLAISAADAGSTITCTYSNTFVQRAELTVDKSSSSTVTQAGDVVSYAISVSNSGNVPINNVDVTDPLPGIALSCTPATPVAVLATGSSINCTATYTVTQADIDRNGASDGTDDGTISNTATATGTTDGGDTVSDDDSVDIPLPAQNFTANFTKDGVLVNDADGSGRGSAGDTIGYTFTVTNTGNSTLESVTINDPRLPSLSCDPSAPIAPGGSVTFGVAPPADVSCTGTTYTITQADIDNQGNDSADGRDVDIDNTATGTFQGPNGSSATLDATDQVPLDLAQPILQIQKSANPTVVTTAGDVVTYSFVVTNPGNVTIDDVTIVDNMAGLGPITCGTDTLPVDLAPGGTLNCSAQYTVTQTDIDAGGNLINSADASGTYNGGSVEDDDQATVNVNPGPGQAELIKRGDKTVVTALGEVITYTFTVNNPSARTLLNVQIIDDSLLGTGLSCNTIPTLAPNASATFTCTGNTYAVQQSDLDSQGNPVADSSELVNTATVQAEYIDNGATVTGTDSDLWRVDLPARGPQMEVVKTSDVNSVSAAGDVITYSFAVTNLGNVTLLNLEVGDPLLTSLSCAPIASLEPGNTATFTCTGNTYAVTQADIDTAGGGDNQINNTATVDADVPGGGSLRGTDSNEVTLPFRQPQMTIVKAADVATVSAPGTINYTFTVANGGNVSVTDLGISDPTLGLSCPTVATLAPGASVSFGGAGSGADQICSGTTRLVSQAEVDAGGTLDNTATASGLTVAGGATPLTASDTLQIPIDRNPTLAFDKVADVTVVNNPGDVINYQITGSNTGNVTLSNVDVADPLIAATLSCTPAMPIAALAPGQGFSCTGSYAATQDDFDTRGGGDGVIENTATATWTGGTTSAGANVDVAAQSQSLTIDKTAGAPTVALGANSTVTDAGDTITYTFVVENTGNVTLAAIGITDPILDAAATCDKVDLPATSPPDSVATCTGTHTITQTEMDAGQVTNSATAQGTPPGSTRISSLPDTVIVTLNGNAAIELTKTASAPSVNLGALDFITDAGDQITYGFSVRNTGSVTLRQVDVADALMPGTDLVCTPAQLAPGALADCGTATYTLLQTDIDAGIVTNAATATGLDPADVTVDDDDAVDVRLAAGPALSLTKTASPSTVSAVNQTVTYTFDVLNEGNVTVTGLVIDETAFSGSGTLSPITCAATSLAPQVGTTCTATYQVTQVDLDAGQITNTAEANGATPDGTAIASDPDDALVTVTATAGLTVSKTASLADGNGNTTADVGEVITYTVSVQNTGNVTVSGLLVGDVFEGGPSTPLSCSPSTLAPTETATCTSYTHTVSQAEFNAGGTLDNTATAEANPPSGPSVSDDASATVALTTATAGLTVSKTASLADGNGNTTADVGEVITYTVSVQNTGNVTVSGLLVGDVFEGGPSTPLSCSPSTLAPTETATCTSYTHTVTQAEFNAGGTLDNTATAEANPPSGPSVSDDASATVALTAATAGLTVSKTASLADGNGNTTADVGEVITYTVSVQNTGNVTVSGLLVGDVFEGGPSTPLSCSPSTLAPTETATCTSYTHTVTQAEFNAGGTLDNTATAEANPPSGPSVSDDASATVALTTATAGLTVSKQASLADGNGNTTADVGEVITYTVSVQNTGNVTVSGLLVGDVFEGGPSTPLSCSPSTLAPTETATCTSYTHTVTQAEFNAGGTLDNTATAEANPPSGPSVSDDASATVALTTATAGLTVSKQASLADGNGNTTADVGEVITYTVSVQNTGNVTVSGLLVGDVFEGGPSTPLSCSPSTLAPTETATCTSYTHTVTQAEFNAGGTLDNTATAEANPPSGPSVSDDASATVALTTATAGLTVSKTVTPTAVANAGDTVSYSFAVENTGNVDVTGLTINETVFTGTGTAPTITCPVTTLAPGASTTCTSTAYAVTQTDVDAGVVNNTATATGTAPDTSTATSAPSSARVSIAANTSLALTKTATPTIVSTVGETVNYSFAVTNDGNVSIDGLAITETAFSGSGTAPTVSCPVTVLAPSASTTCTASYQVTQIDLDAGQITNTATANGAGPGGAPAQSSPSTAVVNATRNASLLLDKSVSPASVNAVDQVLAYSFQVTNNGNVTVNTVTIEEVSFSGTGSMTGILCGPAAGTLAPGASATCTATYRVTQADLDAGRVDNVARANAVGPAGPVVSNDDDAEVTVANVRAASLVKLANPSTVSAAGELVTYTFVLTNDGNQTVTDPSIEELLFSGSGVRPVASCPTGSYGPGEQAVCTATYTVTQDDIDAGAISNRARGLATPPNGIPLLTNESDALVTVTQAPTIVLDKTATVADTNGDGVLGDAGDTITYAFSVENTGNVVLASVTVDDPLLPGLSCSLASLAPGDTASCAATGNTYVITVTDEATGSVTNTATATGDAPGTAPDAVDDDTEITPTESTPASVSVVKTANPASGAQVAPGETLTYTVTATVAGANLHEPVTLTDTLGAGLSFVAVTNVGAYACNAANPLVCTLPAGTPPGDYPVVYTATVAADASGDVGNSVVATKPAGIDGAPVCASCTTSHPVSRASLELAKQLGGNDDADGNGEVSAGDTLSYTVTATNTGNVALANVTVTDPMTTPTSITCAVLAPAATCTLQGAYTVTQADVDAGQVLNAATVVAEPGQGSPALPPEACPAGSGSPNCSAQVVTPINQRPEIATSKTAVLSVDNGTPGKGNAGDVITYSVTVTNTGNLTLSNVTVNDTFQNSAPVQLTCAPTSLTPGQVATCDSYDHTITDAEAGSDRGLLLNTVLADATSLVGGVPVAVTATASVTVDVQNEPAQLVVTKTAGVREANVGDLVRYTVTVQNIGDVDLVDGYLVDTPALGFSYVEGSLQGDDDDDYVTASGRSPLRVEHLDIAAGNTATVVYLMRVGAGVRPGVQVNRAQAFDPAFDNAASNVATAEVLLGSDPLLDESLISGTVFNDRDGDGWQDSAALRNVRVQGGFAASAYVANSTTVDRGHGPQSEPDASSPMLHGIALGDIDGRQTIAEPADAHAVVVRQRLSTLAFTDDFVLTNAQGVSVRMAADGSTRVETQGDAAKGLTAAAPQVERKVAQAADGYVVDYVIRNAGIDERGIPGVRIASVEGLLIETDQYGRYHLLGIEPGNAARGSNFILKVDPATLPAGTVFTTDNPLVRRITSGVPTRFDFGVKLPETVLKGGTEQVEMELGEVLFEPGSAKLRTDYLPVVDKIADQVRRYQGGDVVITATGESEALAFARATAVQAALAKVLDDAATRGLTVSVRTQPDDAATMVAGVAEGGPLLGTVLFDTDQTTIKSRYEPLLDQVAAALEASGGGNIAIIGHADRRGAHAYNTTLGLRRAKAVYDAVAERLSPALRAKVTVQTSEDPHAPVDPAEQQGKE